jgi:hypothetical protein
VGIFKNQIPRLRRQKWANVQMFADEMIALLSSDAPIEIDSPIVINNDTNQSPITINNHSNSDDDITINRYPEPPIDLPEIPPFDFPDGVGDVIIIHINDDGIEVEDAPADDPSNPTPRPSSTPSGGGGLPGVVVSGTGDSYEVDVYEDGLDLPATRRTVRQLQIDSSETIPEGTWAVVNKMTLPSGEDFYFMQVAVFL